MAGVKCAVGWAGLFSNPKHNGANHAETAYAAGQSQAEQTKATQRDKPFPQHALYHITADILLVKEPTREIQQQPAGLPQTHDKDATLLLTDEVFGDITKAESKSGKPVQSRMSGNMKEACRQRNKINREVSRLRNEFYLSKVASLVNNAFTKWWKTYEES